ncbi:MAG: NADP-reducing hydrogenase subunit HndC [Elusimicrobia bacterium ADurb.Bin231]|nr:MAG: NADP-reducing hydrogenase subunit HndC [Elusimicrobia bacterium ADurb.Bin231]
MKIFRTHALVCSGAQCLSAGGNNFKDALSAEINSAGLQDEVQIVETGCMGSCEMGPMMVVYPEGTVYIKLVPSDAAEIVKEHFLKGRPVKRLMWNASGKEFPTLSEIPFFAKQTKLVLRNCGIINPENIEEYIANDGYLALGKVLTSMKPQEVVDEIKKSGLRGRGGAGFLTGLKWGYVASQQSGDKYVICNADEGDPGAYMDRSVLESDPHTLLEGMIIAGYAVGAIKGYIYVRAEYPLAVKRVALALKHARAFGLLGSNILNSGFSFDIAIRMGAGAFVCGEETALINSIEGKRGEPRKKPPYPSTAGLFDKPTLINNVETFANVPVIIHKGAQFFKKIGTATSPGTKVFSLAGKVNTTGLIEVPLGITLREIVFDIGGGIPEGHSFKGALIGGPSGGVVPAEHLDIAIDYESLDSIGTIMGSGGLIIMDETSCMVDIAKFFLKFTVEESCGKCTPCREGTPQMLKILQRITSGEGMPGDIENLERTGRIISRTSLCGLGQSASNPVLSTIRFFKNEYESHINEKKCPSSVCDMKPKAMENKNGKKIRVRKIA